MKSKSESESLVPVAPLLGEAAADGALGQHGVPEEGEQEQRSCPKLMEFQKDHMKVRQGSVAHTAHLRFGFSLQRYEIEAAIFLWGFGGSGGSRLEAPNTKEISTDRPSERSLWRRPCQKA